MKKFSIFQLALLASASLFVASSLASCSDDDDNNNAASKTTPLVGGSVPAVSEAVDLGLASGTLWAPYNVGASSAGEAGALVAWGEANVKTSYEEGNYTGTADVDAAVSNWGSEWKTPTSEQFAELISSCKWTWQEAGIYATGASAGFLVADTAKGSTNAIFLPVNRTTLNPSTGTNEQDGYYWTTDLLKDNPDDYALYLLFTPSSKAGVVGRGGNRYLGHGVRAVVAK